MKKTAVFEYYPETVFIPLNLPDRTKAKIEIVPGQAFGRGFHPTTNLCIRALEQIFFKSSSGEKAIERVLDVGCGSGVLSICASLLGARDVTGLDIDNMIVTEARENVILNGQASKIKIVLDSIEDIPGQFDLACANVLIGSMLPMSEELASKVKPGGLALLSGIKEEDSEKVTQRFTAHGLELVEKNTGGGWVSLLMSNNGESSDSN